MRPGIVNNILAASLYTRSGKWKHVIVVDEDINIEDPNEVLWALTTRFQPATDMFVIPRSITSSLEPSATVDGADVKADAQSDDQREFSRRSSGAHRSHAPNGSATLEGIWFQVKEKFVQIVQAV